MGWETRGGSRYYYRKRWLNGRPVSEYIGAGPVAEVLVELEESERESAARERAIWAETVEVERRNAAALAEVESMVRDITAALLIAQGYHTHRRQWRRQR